jgi:hypothetical protein
VGYGVALGDDAPALGEVDAAPVDVAADVGRAGAQHAEDAVHETVGDGAERLLVVMAAVGHQAMVDGGEFGIRAAGDVGGEDQGTLEAVVAGLGDLLARLVGTAGGGAVREQTAEAAEMTCPLNLLVVQSGMAQAAGKGGNRWQERGVRSGCRPAIRRPSWRTAG